MLDDAVRIVIALGLVLLNGFFVLAEFALVKVRSTRLEELVEAGGKDAAKAKEALRVVSRLDDYLSATQLGITLASLALGWIGEPAFAHLFSELFALTGWTAGAASHGAATTAAFILVSTLHIVIGELTFKTIAIQYAEKSALFSARPLSLFHRVFSIPLSLMNGASRAVLRALRVKPVTELELAYTEEELRSILGASQERGGFSFHHLLLLENAFDFGDLRIRDVMVPLDQTTCLDATKPWAANAEIIAQKRLSRYPLVDGPKGSVIGLVHVKTILLDLIAGRTPDLRREMIRVPRASKELLLEAALRKLQKSGEHMGIATDEAGRPVGMFTLEDIVEELIGDIKDEFEAARDVSIAEILRPEAVMLDPPVADRVDLLDRLVRLACDGTDVDEAKALDLVLKRERQVPSAVAGSVAVPHARVPGLRKPIGAFARVADGVDFQAPDGRAVRLVLLILSPGDAAPGTQSRYLRKVASLMDSDYMRMRLLDAETPAEVCETIRVGETSASL